MSATPAPIETLQWHSTWSPGDAGIHVMRIANHRPTALHDHVFREIVFVESGTAEHLTAASGEPRRLRPGDLIVIRPMVWHAYQRPRGLGIINCLFDQRMMRRLSPFLQDVEGAFELFQRTSGRARDEAPIVLHVRPSERPAMLDRLRRIESEKLLQSNGWRASAAVALLDVLVTAARLHRHQLTETPDRLAVRLGARIERAVQDTVTHLEANFAGPVSLGDLARRVGVSPAHLSRSFGRRMGVGIVEFVHQLRCEEACRLLRTGPESIARIAGRVGYDEVAYFSRRFRQQTGRSPRQYARAADTSVQSSRHENSSKRI